MINACIVILMIKSVAGFFVYGGKGNMEVFGPTAFRYYTVLSNILTAVAAGIMLVFNIRLLASDGACVPYWAMLVYYVGACTVTLTFSIVMFVFVPSTGLHDMITGDNLFMHAVIPALAVLDTVLFNPGPALGYAGIAWALVPTVIYALVYYHMVIVVKEERGGWPDFYGFNAKGKWLVSALLVILIAAVAAFLLLLGRNLIGVGSLGR